MKSIAGNVNYVAALFVCFLLPGPAAAAVYISGRVTAVGTHAPVPDATVSLYTNGQSEVLQVAHSLQNGSFVLRAPEAGNYRLEVEGGGVEPMEQTIEAPSAGIVGLEVKVTLIPVLRVRVLDPQGKPVTGQQVRGWLVVIADHTEGGNHTHQVQGIGFTKISAPDGTVEYAAPQGSNPTQATTIIAGARDAAAGCGMLRLDKWPDTPVTLQLERGVTLSGVVVDREDKPAPGVKVEIQPAAAQPMGLPVALPMTLELAPSKSAAGTRLVATGVIPAAAEEDRSMQEGSPCFYQGSVRTTTDKDGSFEIPFLFSGCHVIVSAALPGGGLAREYVTLGGERMDIRLGWVQLSYLPDPYQLDYRQLLGIPDCY